MKILNTTTRLRLSRLVLLLLASALLVGCVSINRLREAQDSFNQAAAAENAARLGAASGQAAGNLAAIQAGYSAALLSLGKLEPADQASLKNDGLWGGALTLKALCQWRLAQYDQAMQTVAQARAAATNQLYPRDAALIAALPGLIKTDQAYTKMMNAGTMSDIQALLTGDNGAIANIQSARATVDKDHPVQMYLIEAQLAAFRNFTVALEKHGLPPLSHTNQIYVDAQGRLHELSQLAQKLGNTDDQAAVAAWGRILGIVP